MDTLIFDFETLSQNPIDGVVVSLALLTFSENTMLRNGYSYEELLENTKFVKFDVSDQVNKWNRRIEESTLEWWSQQTKEARASIKPSSTDVSITEMIPWISRQFDRQKIKTVFTRNNTFDPVIIQSVCRDFSTPIPYDWWKIRDTKSFIMGLTYGTDIRDSFIPLECENKYVKHDPRHDIVLDVMRLQTIMYHKFGDDDVS